MQLMAESGSESLVIKFGIKERLCCLWKTVKVMRVILSYMYIFIDVFGFKIQVRKQHALRHIFILEPNKPLDK